MTKLVKGYETDAGIDIILDHDVYLGPCEHTTVDLGKIFVLKEGQCGIICPRSSAAKQGIFIATSPIDAHYDGNVHAMVFNSSFNSLHYKKGEAFCQLVVLQLANVDNANYSVKKEGKRGSNGFGSTGV